MHEPFSGFDRIWLAKKGVREFRIGGEHGNFDSLMRNDRQNGAPARSVALQKHLDSSELSNALDWHLNVDGNMALWFYEDDVGYSR